MTTTEAWTIRRLLDWTTDYLKQHGSDSPRLDAEILLAQVKKCDRIFLYTAYEEIASDDDRALFKDLVMQRARGTPVAYLVGHREFFSVDFEVTPDVLIPRPETEFIVTHLIDFAKEEYQGHDTISIADVGTGSGILAICAALHVPNSTLTAFDISDAAIEVAQRNAENTMSPIASTSFQATCLRTLIRNRNSISSSAIRLTSVKPNAIRCPKTSATTSPKSPYSLVPMGWL